MKYLFNIHGLEDKPQVESINPSYTNIYHIVVELEPNLKVKTARVFVIVKNLERSGKILSITPSLDDILARKFDNSFELDFQTDLSLEKMETKVKNAGDVAKTKINKKEFYFNPLL